MEKISQATIDYFRYRGWETKPLHFDEVLLRGTIQGNPIRCADDRHPEQQIHFVPAFFGGIDGIAALCHLAGNIENRYKIAVDKVINTNFLPGSHDDEHGGEGCAFRQAWIDGRFQGLPSFSKIEAAAMRMFHRFHHFTLRGHHSANGLLVNFEPGATVLPKGYLVCDLWYPLQPLGFKPDEVLSLAASAAELILPLEQRNLFILGK